MLPGETDLDFQRKHFFVTDKGLRIICVELMLEIEMIRHFITESVQRLVAFIRNGI